jgi:hypothetical protein
MAEVQLDQIQLDERPDSNTPITGDQVQPGKRSTESIAKHQLIPLKCSPSVDDGTEATTSKPKVRPSPIEVSWSHLPRSTPKRNTNSIRSWQVIEDGSASQSGPKTPLTPGGHSQTASGTAIGGRRRTRKDKDRKIGHRRVDDTGQVTYKKIETSQLCGSIQLGIGYAVGGLASKPERDLLMQDFAMVETTSFSADGSNITPAHHYSDFKFKTYAPVAFRYFRDLFGIQPDDFLLSVVSESMIELCNPGASGSVFYLTMDDEFIIKTVQHKEAEFLQKLLPGYYMVRHDLCAFQFEFNCKFH